MNLGVDYMTELVSLREENARLRKRIDDFERQTCPICLRAENERLKAELAKRGE